MYWTTSIASIKRRSGGRKREWQKEGKVRWQGRERFVKIIMESSKGPRGGDKKVYWGGRGEN